MNSKKQFLLASSVIISIFLGFLIGTRQNSDQLKVPVVRSYTAPAGRGDEIKNALNDLFWVKDNDGAIANAQAFADGTILVRAPEGYQVGINSLIQNLSKNAGASRAVIKTEYWMVTAEKSKSSNEAAFPTFASVLASITAIDGPKNFRILEHISFNSVDGTKVRTKGSYAEAKGNARLTDGKISLNIRIDSGFGEVDTNTQIKPGEYVVLGQNSLGKSTSREDIVKNSAGETEGMSVYHIIRSDLQK